MRTLKTALLCTTLALLMVGSAGAQRLTVGQFKGATVGDKLTNAQAACNDSYSACVLDIGPELSALTGGSLPAKCAKCTWLDWTGLYGGVAGNKSLDGVRYASQYSGADWAAKVAAAIADLPTGGGTVFVASSLAGTATGGLTVPANVSLQFDVGTFTLSGSVAVNGLNHNIAGVRGATSLMFTGATDGIVLDTTTNGPRYTSVSDLKLITTNANGGAAFNSSYTGAASPTDFEVQRVVIDTSGAGQWAYGLYLNNVQYSRFYNVRIIGNAVVGLHLEAAEENLFDNFFVSPHGGTPARCVESLTSTINGSYSTLIGGGCYGGYAASAIYAAAGQLYLYAFTTDNPDGATPSDGAYVVANGGKLTVSGSKLPSSALVKGGGSLQISGGNIGDVNIDATAFSASIVGVSYRSLTNNLTNGGVMLFANTTWGGAIANDVKFGSVRVFSNGSNGSADAYWNAARVFSWGASGVIADNAFGIGTTTLTLKSEGVFRIGQNGAWDSSGGLEVTNLYLAGTVTTGRAACVKSDKSVGYCSTQPDSSGACTCN